MYVIYIIYYIYYIYYIYDIYIYIKQKNCKYCNFTIDYHSIGPKLSDENEDFHTCFYLCFQYALIIALYDLS